MHRKMITDDKATPDEAAKDIEFGSMTTAAESLLPPEVEFHGPSVQAKLSFRDVTYDCKTKRILHGISGYVSPGQVLAVMGASGCGKTTLLDVLGNRKIKGGRMTGGQILINDRVLSDSEQTKNVGYVAQDDSLLGGFSVRETFWFTARLIHGYKNMTSDEIHATVEGMIRIMGLQSCANVRVGNAILRGISGGQKRRVSIGIALLARHPVLLLDEPTSGLDSVTAFAIMEQLKKIAALGHSVMATIHQPSSAIYELFDSILLLSAGQMVYFGKADDAVGFFENEFGIPCPDFFNPADFLLDVMSVEFSTLRTDQVLTTDEMVARYARSNSKTQALAGIDTAMNSTQLTTKSSTEILSVETKRPGTFSRTVTLVHRGTVNLVRNPGLLFIRWVMYVLLALSMGLAFFGNKGQDNDQAIQALTSTVYFSPNLYLFMSCTVIPFYFDEKAVFFREYKNGLTSVTSFVISSILTSIPGSLLLSISTLVIIFFMVGLRNFGLVFAWWWVTMLLGEVSAMFFAMISPHYMVGLVLSCGLWGGTIMLSGYLTMMRNLTWAVRWLGYCIPNRYFFQASMKAQWEGVGAMNSPLFSSGDATLEYYEIYSFTGYKSFWIDWIIVLGFCGAFGFAFAIASWRMVNR